MSLDERAIVEALRGAFPAVPSVAAVLGSGLGHLEDALEDRVSLPFDSLGLPPSGVVGHAGRFVHGRLGSTSVLFQAGRYHLYEGHSPDVVAAPVRVLARLGVRALVLTNAAGAVRPDLSPGDLVLLEDHIGLYSRSPLVGPQRDGEPRFPDMSAPYDADLRALAERASDAVGVRLESGVYAAVLGPQFETAAEIRALRLLGADVVGMSTVPEVVVARAAGVRCVAFSVVTNMGTGLSSEPVSHEDVLAVGREAGQRLGRVLEAMLAEVDAVLNGPGRSG